MKVTVTEVAITDDEGREVRARLEPGPDGKDQWRVIPPLGSGRDAELIWAKTAKARDTEAKKLMK